MIDPFFKYLNNELQQSPSRHLYVEPDDRYKSYHLSKPIPLSRPSLPDTHLDRLLLERSSSQSFIDKPIPEELVSSLLKYSAGLSVGERRMHPSGGGKYPIELYPVIFNAGGIEEGIYHYNIENHELEGICNDISGIRRSFSNDVSNNIVKEAPFLVLFTFSKDRSVPKYGNFAYKLGLIEAGHIGQNFYLVAGALGLGCRVLAGGNPDSINQLLYVDGINETFFFTAVIGYE